MNIDQLLEENKKLKEELAKSQIIRKIQKDMLRSFELHDDAGTAYIYLGPNNEELEKVTVLEDLDNLNQEERYNYILKALYEIDTIMDSEANKEITNKIENLHSLIFDTINNNK